MKTLPFLIVLSLGACTQERAVFVPPGVPVRLDQHVKGAQVMVKDAETGNLVSAKADLWPGMWIVVDPAEWDVPERQAFMNLERSPQ